MGGPGSGSPWKSSQRTQATENGPTGETRRERHKVRKSWLLRELTLMGRDGLGRRNSQDSSKETSEGRQRSEISTKKREGVDEGVLRLS